MEQIEYDEETLIVNEAGVHINPGWARKDVFSSNPYFSNALWNGFTSSCKCVVFSKSYMFVFELCDCGLLGFASVCAVSLLDKHITAKTLSFPVSTTAFYFPARESSSIRFNKGKLLLEFITIGRGNRILKIDFLNLEHNRALRGELVLTPPPNAQPLWTHTIWNYADKKFQLSCASPWWNTEGVIHYQNTELIFRKNRSWGISLWNKTAPVISDTHYWAAGCGLYGGRLISFSLGNGTADCGSGTENAFFINGIIHKLELVSFHTILKNGALPTKFTSSDLRLDMNFYPIQEYKKLSSNIIQSKKTREAFGFFSGSVILDDGSSLNFERITGLVEIRESRAS